MTEHTSNPGRAIKAHRSGGGHAPRPIIDRMICKHGIKWGPCSACEKDKAND